MTAQRELEIKLKLPPASVGRVKKTPLIRALKALPKRATEISVYFDTDKRKLRKNGLMLRVRRIGNHYLQTIQVLMLDCLSGVNGKARLPTESQT
jgi:triphosphatase